MAHEDLLTPEFVSGVIRFITARSGSPTYDEDLTQEALLRAVVACRRVKHIAYPRAFFGKVIKDTVYDSWRRRRPIEVELRPEAVPTSPNAVEEDFDRKRKVDQIRRALQELDGRDRAIFKLFYFEQRGIKEIADQFSTSDSAIKMVLLRSRRKIMRDVRIFQVRQN